MEQTCSPARSPAAEAGDRIRLEGQLEVLEAAQARYLALSRALRGLRWRRRVSGLTPVIDEIAAGEARVEEALRAAERLAAAKRSAAGPAEIRGASACRRYRDLLLELVSRRLTGDRGELVLSARLARLKQCVAGAGATRRYDRAWRSYRIRLACFLLSWVGFPALFLAGTPAYEGSFDTPGAGDFLVGFGPLWLGAFLLSGLRLQVWRCPRCEKNEHHGGGFRKGRCVHCGLPRWARNPGEPPTPGGRRSP